MLKPDDTQGLGRVRADEVRALIFADRIPESGISLVHLLSPFGREDTYDLVLAEEVAVELGLLPPRE